MILASSGNLVCDLYRHHDAKDFSDGDGLVTSGFYFRFWTNKVVARGGVAHFFTLQSALKVGVGFLG